MGKEIIYTEILKTKNHHNRHNRHAFTYSHSHIADPPYINIHKRIYNKKAPQMRGLILSVGVDGFEPPTLCL